MSSLLSLGAGAPILALLALLSLLSLSVIAARTLALRAVTSGEKRRLDALSAWSRGDQAGARRLVAAGHAPADRVLLYAMDRVAEGRRGTALLGALVQRGGAELARMTRLLRLLELIAMTGPLLGLLGTVLGMIQSFRALELADGSANASILAGGIWEALLTTAAGLLVAIPAAVGAALLAARAERATQMIEAAVSELLLIEARPDLVR